MTEEKRHLWLGPVHQVATKAHATNVCRSSLSVNLSVGMYLRIMSKISGGSVTDVLDSGEPDYWGSIRRIYDQHEEVDPDVPIMVAAVCVGREQT